MHKGVFTLALDSEFLFLIASIACWFFSSWNFFQVVFFFLKLTIYFSPHETSFVHWTCFMRIFVHGTWVMLIFVRGTCCMLVFSLRETCTLIFLLRKLILFMELDQHWFSSWNFLYVDLSPFETRKWIFLLVKLILFMGLSACWYFCSWKHLNFDFFLWNLYIQFFFSFWHFFMFILLVACWFLFLKRVASLFFFHETCNVLIFSLCQTCTLIFGLVKLILFMELVIGKARLGGGGTVPSMTEPTSNLHMVGEPKLVRLHGEKSIFSFMMRKTEIQEVSQTQISTQQVPRLKNQHVTACVNKISFNLQVSRREK